MGMTLAEKIMARKLGREVRAGEIVVAPVDMAIVQDGTGPLSFEMIRKMKGRDYVLHPERALLTIDHTGPSPRADLSNFQVRIRQFAKETGAHLADVGEGISHVLMGEDYAKPGDVIVGADSHTCTAGALAAFATGMGSTDAAIALALGKMWFRVPETLRFLLRGKLPAGVYSKDIILHIIGTIGDEGGSYRAMEYGGELVPQLSLDARSTMSSMAQEADAKLGLFPSDGVTKRWLEERGRGGKWIPLEADPDAKYEKTFEIDCAKLEPLISLPHQPGNVKPVREVAKEGVKVHQVFVGTCTNGRMDDLRAVARVLKGRRVHPETRFLIYPGSRSIYRRALQEGLLEVFLEAGVSFGTAGCGPCAGIHHGMLGDGEVCVAAQNRNFMGRLGNPKSFVYLSSPATAAACAVAGKVADPRDYL